MEYVRLGQTGLKVSELAFGAMSFGGYADEAESARMFAACRDAGINTFDCADVYNGGRSEEILGRLVSDCRDELVLTTKAYFPSGPGPNDRGSSRRHLVRSVENSLRRLGTDRVELFFLHRFDDGTPLEETLRAVDDLVTQGKILYPAVSNFSAWQTMKAVGMAGANGWARPVCSQPMYNLVKRQAEVEILPMAASEGLGVLPYSPLGGGLLTGKYAPGVRPEVGRIVETPMYGTRYGAPLNYEIAQAFTQTCRELGHHPAAVAIAWVASHPAVTAPLLGARNVAQLRDALGAVAVDMTPELRDRISSLSPQPPPATDRNEEGSTASYGRTLLKTR
jgi:aryl-alcohol dehydrogenase-like predicted oxidoreductase